MFISLKSCMSCEKLLVEALYSTCVMWFNAWKQTLFWITTVILSLEDKWTVLSLLDDKQNCKFEGVCKSSFTTNFCIEKFYKMFIFSPIYGSFCRFVHIFRFSLILFSRNAQHCEFNVFQLQFQVKRMKIVKASNWCLAKRGLCA